MGSTGVPLFWASVTFQIWCNFRFGVGSGHVGGPPPSNSDYKENGDNVRVLLYSLLPSLQGGGFIILYSRHGLPWPRGLQTVSLGDMKLVPQK